MTLLAEKLSATVLSAKDGDLVIVKYKDNEFDETDFNTFRTLFKEAQDLFTKDGKNVKIAIIGLSEEQDFSFDVYPNYTEQLGDLITTFNKQTSEERKELQDFLASGGLKKLIEKRELEVANAGQVV